MRRLVAVALTGLVLATGCRDDNPQRRASTGTAPLAPATRAELIWLGAVNDWYATAAANSTLAERACTAFERGNELEAEAVAKGDGELLAAANERFKLGERLLEAIGRQARALSPDPTRRLPVRGGVSEQSRIEPLLSRHASRLSGVRAEVRCWSSADWARVGAALPGAYGFATDPYPEAGWVTSPALPTAHLSPAICRPLARRAYESWLPRSEADRLNLATAIAALVHESEHLAGSSQEDVAECHAVQRVRELSRQLGLGAGLAGELATLYWREIYPFLPDEYRSGECRDGGALDLNRTSSSWP